MIGHRVDRVEADGNRAALEHAVDSTGDRQVERKQLDESLVHVMAA